MLKNIFLSEKKLLNAILRAKLKYMKNFLSNEMNSFCNAEDRFHEFELFCRKVILELKCTKSLLRASKNTNSVFSATKQIMRMRGHRCSKTSFSVRKVTKCNFKSKAQYMKHIFLSNEMNSFLQCRRQIFMCLAFLQKKSF